MSQDPILQEGNNRVRKLDKKAHRPLGGLLRVRTEQEETLDKKPSPLSSEQAQSTDGDGLQVNGHASKEPASSVTNDENQGLKVGDKVRYVGKKYRESIGNQVMEVVKISVHWTGNQVTCSYDKGWTTWLTESSLEKVKRNLAE